MRLTSPMLVVPTRTLPAGFGEKGEPVDLDEIGVTYRLDPPQVITTQSGEQTVQDGRLYTERGVDLTVGDRVPLPEGNFGVTAGPWPDFDHPMSGRDMGLVRFFIRRGG